MAFPKDFAETVPDIEHELFKRKTILVTAGTTGVGMDVTGALLARGAEHVITTTRSPANFDKLQTEISNAGMDPERAVPLFMDITQEQDRQTAIERLGAIGLRPDHVVLSAAGGMEPFLLDLGKELVRVSRAQGLEKEGLLDALTAKMEAWVKAAMPHALNVNYKGPKYFINRLMPEMNPGGIILDISSLWSTFARVLPIPIFYRVVSEPKQSMETYMQWHEIFSENHLYPAVVTGNMLTDTLTGKFLLKYGLSLIPPESRPDVSIFPTTADMATAIIQVLASNPSNWTSETDYTFVMGKGDIRKHVDKTDPLLQFPLPSQFFSVRR